MEATKEPTAEATQRQQQTVDKDDEIGQQNERQQQLLYEKARSMWLSGTHLDEVERILYNLWNNGKGLEEVECNDSEGRPQKRLKNVNNSNNTTTTTTTNLDPKEKNKKPCSTDVLQQSQVGPRLALWLIQSGRVSEADKILQQLSYECRLSSRILLVGKDDGNGNNDEHRKTNSGSRFLAQQQQQQQPPCHVYDRFLSDADLAKLRSVFGDIDSTYWTDHDYSVEPPSPYYSFLIPLSSRRKEAEPENFGFLGSLIERLRDCLLDWQPLIKTCTHCEMWAHNRPSATGHQMHFDTDNEGICDSDCSAVRHPLVTCILYLTDVGGPSLVTNQRKASRHAADKGWLSHAKVGRMMAMDGRVLHCVVPGKATTDPQRRVTLMLAFWRRIKMRGQDETKPGGAARKFPVNRPWAKALRDPSVVSTPQADWDKHKDRLHPQPLDHVFENLQGKPWPVASGLPSYDCVFQGI